MLTLAGTGHRPDKLGGYGETVYNRLVALCEASLHHFKPHKVISGMALGFDLALAQASLNLKIPLCAYLPCLNQDAKWQPKQQQLYKEILSQAESVVMCGPGGEYAAFKMQLRNERMVDDCELLLALWDGSTGGTGNCIAYAKKIQRQICNIWRSWEKYK